MAKKRVHELAKERDMSPRDMLAKLQAAGLPVKAVASAVDEQLALDALAGKKVQPKQNGSDGGSGPKIPQRPDAVRPFGSGSTGRVVRPSQVNRQKSEPPRGEGGQGQGGPGQRGPGGPGQRGPGGPGQRGPGGPGQRGPGG